MLSAEKGEIVNHKFSKATISQLKEILEFTIKLIMGNDMAFWLLAMFF